MRKFGRIMVTGAGGPGAVNLSRSLLSMKPKPWILAVDASEYYVHLALGHARACVPRCADEAAYIDAINALVTTHDIDFIFPNNSLEIRVLSAHRDALRAEIFLPSPETLDRANSKWLSYLAFREAGVPTPDTRLINTPGDLDDAFAVLRSDTDVPAWVRGAGIPGKGVGVASLPCRTSAQAEQWIDYHRGWGAMIASSYLPGANLTWMGLFDTGELIVSQGRERHAYVIPHVSPSGITGAPAISETIHDERVNQTGHAAVLATDPEYTGVAFVDMKSDPNGVPKVTEINAGRFGTTHYFYSAAGANFPAFLLSQAAGEPLTLPQFNVLRAGKIWIRTLDAGPVLTTREALADGAELQLSANNRWPNVPQVWHEFFESD